jgi:hypothetical protein
MFGNVDLNQELCNDSNDCYFYRLSVGMYNSTAQVSFTSTLTLIDNYADSTACIEY